MVVADKKTNRVLTTRKATFNASTQLTLRFEPLPDTNTYKVYALCDSYVGCDQAEEILIE